MEKEIKDFGAKIGGTGNVTEDDFINNLGIRGGEFEKWMSDVDAQWALNQCYEAFFDLARVLKISPESISLNHTLAIGFSSRGHSAAAEHYETLRQVIKLTKFGGKGALCHEWGHALDDAIGRYFKDGYRSTTSFASENLRNKNLPDSFRKLINAMCYKTILVEDNNQEEKEKLKKLEKKFYQIISVWKPETLPEDMKEKWNNLCKSTWEARIECDITPFKEGGSYPTITGAIRKIDNFQKVLIMESGEIISINDIVDMDSSLFRELL